MISPHTLTIRRRWAPGRQGPVRSLQTGGGEDALRSRSALPLAPKIKASVLILNGARDDRTDPDQARRFAQAISAHGGRARVHIYEQFGHEIPVKAREPEIDAFIDETLRR
ncbi:alpha/beta hydrolase family protein [Caulobacter segnis]